jgi:mitochondrial fission protein ELM1
MSLLRRRLHPERLNRQRIAEPVLRVTPSHRQPRVIWRFSDGKAGHDNQSLGLVDALARRMPVMSFDIQVPGGAGRDWLRRRFPAGSLLPDPWLLIGAGHTTHIPLLAARRARGGRATVLMSPDLPNSLFDLCVIPEHDRPAPAANVVVTRGSLNRMQALPNGSPERGLLLVGGPSRHFLWDHDVVLLQLARVIRYSPVRHWVLTTSRRTPAGFAEQVRQLIFNRNIRISVFSWRDTAEHWLRTQLGLACCTWVTEDSVSMIYESLTAGIPVGLLSVPARRDDRVVRGVRALAASNNARPFHDWCAGRPLCRPVHKFDEANRVAEHICGQWGRG